MPNFDLWSDFHFEQNRKFDWFDYDIGSKYLVLAGDTANDHNNTLRVLFDASKVYEKVAFVTGNHDYYVHHDIKKIDDFLFKNKPKNAYFLNYEDLVTDDIVFVGNMGWYSWDYPGMGNPGDQAHAWMQYMNDSRCITFEKDLPRDLAQKHAEDIKNRLAAWKPSSKKFAVITHTVPTERGLVNASHPWAPLNGSYYNSFMKDVWSNDELKPDVWCFGHTHFHHDFVENGVRFVANARGYHHEGGSQQTPVTIDL